MHVGQEATLSMLQTAYGDGESELVEETDVWRSRTKIKELLERKEDAMEETRWSNDISVLVVGGKEPDGNELVGLVMASIDDRLII